MDKFAQKRSLKSRIWEKVNVPGKALESLHSEFQELMDEVREVDNKVREIAEDVRPFMRGAKSALRRRNYLDAAYNIAGFHQRCRHIAHLLSQFDKSVNIKHYKYLLDTFEHPLKDTFFSYNPNEEIKEACQEFDDLVKVAFTEGLKDKTLRLLDWTSDKATNIGTGAGWGKRLMQKRFNHAFMKEMVQETTNIVNKSERMLSVLLNIFSTMESGVSRRNPRLFLVKVKEFVNKFNVYHKEYLKYDEKILKPLKEYQKELEQSQKEEAVQKEEQQKAQEHENYQQNVIQDAQRIEQQVREQEKHAPPVEVPPMPQYKEPTFEQWQKEHSEANKVLDDLDKKQDDKVAHINFIDTISKHASNNQILEMVQEILNYSQSLEETDPSTSKGLLETANAIINDYKSAGLFDFLKSKKKSEDEQEPEQVAQPQDKPAQQLPKTKKPQELVEQDATRYQFKTIDLPEGRVDEAYKDIPVLARITPDKMRISPNTIKLITDMFARRMSNLQTIDNFEPYIKSVDANLFKNLKNEVYNGWVSTSHSVNDNFNPRDKYLEIYTRINLSNVDPRLIGTAKMYVNCRLSADTGTLTIRGIQKYFTIEVKETNSDEEDYDNDELDYVDPEHYPEDQYEYGD